MIFEIKNTTAKTNLILNDENKGFKLSSTVFKTTKYAVISLFLKII